MYSSCNIVSLKKYLLSLYFEITSQELDEKNLQEVKI